jgi:hypothetical protein
MDEVARPGRRRRWAALLLPLLVVLGFVADAVGIASFVTDRALPYWLGGAATPHTTTSGPPTTGTGTGTGGNPGGSIGGAPTPSSGSTSPPPADQSPGSDNQQAVGPGSPGGVTWPTQPAPVAVHTPTPTQTIAGRDPWLAPAGTPEWTLHHGDAISFGDSAEYREAPGWGDPQLMADDNLQQLNWYQWTDSLDLSIAGCRNAQKPHWNAIKLDGFTTPRTYCRVDPQNTSRLQYIEFTAKDMAATPRYVKVRAWVIASP